jgi:acetyltransferase-like isoleucine patch superfamily enzyme
MVAVTVASSGMSMRRESKRLVFGASLLLASPLIVAAWLEKRMSRGEAIFVASSQLLSLIPDLVGVHIRAAFYYATLEDCHWEVHVGFGSIFTHRGATLARNVSMGAYCIIGHADIAERVMMGSRISIPSGKRQHFDDSDCLTDEPRFARVAIGAGTWVGEGAVIMARVGARSIVSAGTVVIKETPDDCLIGGNPARMIRALGRRTQNKAAS